MPGTVTPPPSTVCSSRGRTNSVLISNGALISNSGGRTYTWLTFSRAHKLKVTLFMGSPSFLVLMFCSAPLGTVPPPASLAAVPVRGNLLPAQQVGLLTTTAPAAYPLSNPVVYPTPTPAVYPLSTPMSAPGPSHAQTGLVLSPSAEPLPQRLVEKIRCGHLVDMKRTTLP